MKNKNCLAPIVLHSLMLLSFYKTARASYANQTYSLHNYTVCTSDSPFYPPLPTLTAEEFKDFTSLAQIPEASQQTLEPKTGTLTEQEKKDIFKRYCESRQLSANASKKQRAKSSLPQQVVVSIPLIDDITEQPEKLPYSLIAIPAHEHHIKRSRTTVYVPLSIGPVIPCLKCTKLYHLSDIRRHFKQSHPTEKIPPKDIQRLKAWTTIATIPTQHFEITDYKFICLVCKQANNPLIPLPRLSFIKHYNEIHRHNNEQEVVDAYIKWLKP